MLQTYSHKPHLLTSGVIFCPDKTPLSSCLDRLSLTEIQLNEAEVEADDLEIFVHGAPLGLNLLTQVAFKYSLMEDGLLVISLKKINLRKYSSY